MHTQEAKQNIKKLLKLNETSSLANELLSRIIISREILDTVHNTGHDNLTHNDCLNAISTSMNAVEMYNMPEEVKERIRGMFSAVEVNESYSQELLNLHRENMIEGINAIDSALLSLDNTEKNVKEGIDNETRNRIYREPAYERDR